MLELLINCFCLPSRSSSTSFSVHTVTISYLVIDSQLVLFRIKSLFRIMKNGTYVFCTFVLHLFFFLSIFDIYLTSPVIVGLQNVPKRSEAVSKRIVIVSIDGMKHSTFMESNDDSSTYRSQHVLDRVCENGFFGKSITQLPINPSLCHSITRSLCHLVT